MQKHNHSRIALPCPLRGARVSCPAGPRVAGHLDRAASPCARQVSPGPSAIQGGAVRLFCGAPFRPSPPPSLLHLKVYLSSTWRRRPTPTPPRGVCGVRARPSLSLVPPSAGTRAVGAALPPAAPLVAGRRQARVEPPVCDRRCSRPRARAPWPAPAHACRSRSRRTFEGSSSRLCVVVRRDVVK